MKKGLLSQSMMPADTPPMDKSAQMPMDDKVPFKEEPATESEQKAFTAVEMAVMQTLYDDATHPQIMKMLGQMKDDPAAGMAQVSELVWMQMDEKSGGKIPLVNVVKGLADVLDQVAELSEKSGLWPTDQQMVARAYQMLLSSVLPKYGADPEELEQLQQEIGPDNLKAMFAQQDQIHSGGMADGRVPV